MRDNNTVWTRILSKTLPHPPACWEDNETIWNPSGGDTYEIHVNDPEFTTYSFSNNGSIGILGNLSGVSILGLPLPVLGAAYAVSKQSQKGGKRKSKSKKLKSRRFIRKTTRHGR
jgi:hypothetical protein